MMLNREIVIPKALHELHGERASLGSLMLVYLTGLVVGGLALGQMLPLALPWWKLTLAVLVFFDIGGGVAANFSESTRLYYQKRANLRLIFLGLHVIHPLVLVLVFPQSVVYMVFVMVYTLACAYGVNAIKNGKMGRTLAAVFAGMGVCAALLFPLEFRFLYALAPLFLMKLVMGFAVRQPAKD